MLKTTIKRPETPVEQKKPRCPHCGVRPVVIFISVIQFGSGAQAVVFACSNCEKVLSVAPIETTRATPEPARSKILLPV
jgi:transcription elongation factor Elf1